MNAKIDTPRLVESAEARAYADLLRAAPPEWRCRAVESDAATILVHPAIDLPLFNRALCVGLSLPATEELIASIVGEYERAGVRNFAIQPSPAAKPPELRDWMAACGLVPTDNWAKVYRPGVPSPARATPLHIERVDRTTAGLFALIICTAFRMPDAVRPWIEATVGRPGWHHYLARSGGVPVAGGAMHVHGQTAWLGMAGTDPAYRRMGAQGALMARRIEEGRMLGCTWFVTETGEDLPERPNPSFHNMLRNDFILAYQRPNYMRPGR